MYGADPGGVSTPPRRSSAAHWLLALLVVPLLLAALALALLPWLAAGPGAQLAGRWLQRPVALHGLSFDPLQLMVRIDGLDVGPWHAHEALTAANAEIRIGHAEVRLGWAALLAGRIEVLRLHVDAPALRLQRGADGVLNVQDLLERFLGRPSDGPAPTMALHDLLLRDGTLDWRDIRIASHHQLSGLQLELPLLSTRDAGAPIEPRMYAQLDGHLLVLFGSAHGLDPQQGMSVHVEVEDLRLPGYTDLLVPPAGLDLRDGRFDARLDLHIQLRPHALPGVQASGRLALRDVDVRAASGSTTPLLAMSRLELPVVQADLDRRSVTLGTTVVRGFALHATRAADGRLDWVTLARRLQAELSPPERARAPGEQPARALGRPWVVDAQGLDFREGSFDWHDQALARPVHMAIHDATLTVGPVHWPGTAPIGFALALRGDRQEGLYLGGLLRPGEPSLDAEARLDHIDTDRFSPYFESRLPVRVRSAPFSSRAHLAAGIEGGAAHGRIDGLEFRLPRVQVTARDEARTLLQLEGLEIHGLAGDTRQGMVSVQQLRWQKLRAPLGRTLEARSGPAALGGLAADWRGRRYRLDSVSAQQLAVPEWITADILSGAGLDLDLAARRHTLQSLAAAGLVTPRGLRAAAFQVADASADLASGHYSASLLNAAVLEAPGDNRIGGISLRDVELDQDTRHYTLGAVTGQDIALGGRIRLPELDASGAELDAGQRHVHLARLVSRGARIELTRTPQGRFDFGSLRRALEAFPSTTASVTGSNTAAPPALAAPAATGGAAAGPDWHGGIGEVHIEDCAGSWQDRQLAVPATLHWSALALQLSHVGTRLDRLSGVDASVHINESTRLAVHGQLALDPLQGTLALDLTGLQTDEWLPWLPRQLPLTPQGGSLDLAGSVQLRGRLADPALFWDGQARWSGVTLLDRPGGETLLAWNSLQVEGVKLNSTPLDVAIGQVTVDRLRTELQLLADGSFNLSRALSTPPPQAGASGAAPRKRAAAAAPARGTRSVPAAPHDVPRTPFPLSIGRIALRNSSVDFSDHFVRPEYSAHLQDLEGSISGLSSHAATPGRLELAGRLDGGASVRVSGTLQPLRQPLALDLQALVRGFELGPLSSYSTRFTGYPIVRGKLSFDVGYHLHDGNIEASNQLTLDQLTLGPRQEVHGIRQLPVDLAVSLLKNSDGVIQVDLPIQGTLADPQFNLGNIIAQLVTRAVERAITAPFRWLGSLFGGEHVEDLGWIAFTPGSDALDTSAIDKLQHLAAALHARPTLRLDIAAHGDAALDAQGLIEDLFRQKLLVQKIQQLIVAGQPVLRPEDVSWSDAERPGLLAAAWRLEHAGQPVPLRPEQLEADLRGSLHNDAGELGELGVRRARAAQDWLTGAGGIDPERVFVVGQVGGGGTGGSAEVQGTLPAARIDFSVR